MAGDDEVLYKHCTQRSFTDVVTDPKVLTLCSDTQPLPTVFLNSLPEVNNTLHCFNRLLDQIKESITNGATATFALWIQL